MVCERPGDRRELTVEEVKTGCWLMYSKQGIKKRTAHSLKGNTHCELVRDQMRQTLEKANFRCQWN